MSQPPVCFVHGTGILTTDGEIPVERLKPGDRAVLATGGAAPIQWIGWRRIPAGLLAEQPDHAPILILRGAFGPERPHRDLRVSSRHGVMVAGALIEAASLVNGLTIAWDRAARDVTYYHVELPEHGLLLSEGLATESYLEYFPNRSFFANNTGPTECRPAMTDGPAEPRNCAPRLRAGPLVDQARRQLGLRACRLGFLDAALARTFGASPDGPVRTAA